MDSNNERLIHAQLVDAASQEGTSQYVIFIIIYYYLLFIIIYYLLLFIIIIIIIIMIMIIIININTIMIIFRYFLITPKLLPDLKYNSKMKILCVYNGEWQMIDNENDHKIDFKKYISNRKKKYRENSRNDNKKRRQ